MKIKSSNPYLHIIYWFLVLFVLTIVFGLSWKSNIGAFFFISSLLPLVIGTSYFFNYYLVPKFYLKKKYFQFGLYTFYTIVISLYLEMIALLGAFVYIGEFSFNDMGIRAADTFLLAIVMYFLVFLWSFLLMSRQIRENQLYIQALVEVSKKQKEEYLEIISNRKLCKVSFSNIIYIESLTDFIQVNAKDELKITSKEKISKLEQRLPNNFLRIHRSFIVNKDFLTSISYNEVFLDEIHLNIGRSYRQTVKEALLNKGKNLLDK